MIASDQRAVKPPGQEPRASPEDAEVAVMTFLAQRARDEMEMRRRLLDEAETVERLARGWRW